jgi:hypothetical protein
MPDEKIDHKRPAHADSELRKMQQRLVDDTVDDSFPASDPPAWTTAGTKSVAANTESNKAPDAPQGTNAAGPAEDGTIARMSRLAEQVYESGRHYAREAQQRLPEAERYIDQGRRAAARSVESYPLTAVILAGAAGFALAWFIYRGTESRGRREVPPYGRQSRYGWRPGQMNHSERRRAEEHLANVSRAAGAAGSAPNSF